MTISRRYAMGRIVSRHGMTGERVLVPFVNLASSRRAPGRMEPNGRNNGCAYRGETMPQQKRGLGKGLGALIPTAPSSATGQQAAEARPDGHGQVPAGAYFD